MKPEKPQLYILMVLTTVFCFLFTLLAIDVSLHHHFQQTAWQSTSVFGHYFMTFAGGPAEYMALFISQFFYSNWVGSLIISVFGLLICYLIFKSIDIRREKLHLSFFIIPLIQIILMALMCDYKFHFAVIFNLFMVSFFLFICTALQKKEGFTISYHNIVAGIFLYYISGGMYFLIFMLSSIFLLPVKSIKVLVINTVFLFFMALLVPYVAHRYIFPASLNSSFFRSTPDVAAMLRYGRPILFYITLAIIPVVVLLGNLTVLTKIYRNKTISLKNKTSTKCGLQKVFKLKYNIWPVAIAIQLLLLIAVSGYVLYTGFKPMEKFKIEISYEASQQNWEQVIALCSKQKAYDRMVNFQFNRALMNTGQLLEKLFNYEQLLGSQGLFLDKPFASEVALPNSDIYFDLGNIDESQRYAFESETLMANSPRVLKRLILNCLIMNNPDAANTFLNVLASNPMEKKWVENYRRYIEKPELADVDSLILKKRADMNKTEGMLGTPPLKLISQLERNPQNKAAFECLIAFDLLEHDLASLTEDFQYIGKMNYQKLPVILEEAIVLFRSHTRNNEFLNRIRVSKQTTDRFNEFAKLTSAAKGDRNKAKLKTADFKNTYWYYVLFLSPKVTNVKLETRPVESNY
jgi:hypothetical protein